VAVGIDVGGTKTAAARCRDDGTVLAIEDMPTPAETSTRRSRPS
jgi:predicted NBD/HSP70 family sugar kinase